MNAAPRLVPAIMVFAKVRIRFRKSGDLRLISHHDLMRCWERMLRRSNLPFHSTSGFNPKPRLIFPLSLGLGIIGTSEVAELEMDQPVPPDEVFDRLRTHSPPGLEILEVRSISARAGGGQVRRVTYRIEFPADHFPELARRTPELLATAEWWVERTRPQPRRLDLRPYLHDLRIAETSLEMDLWVTPTGTARPEEVLGLLGLGDLTATGMVLVRTTVELHDEEPLASVFPRIEGKPREEPHPGNSRPSDIGASGAGSHCTATDPATPAAVGPVLLLPETDTTDRPLSQKGNA